MLMMISKLRDQLHDGSNLIYSSAADINVRINFIYTTHIACGEFVLGFNTFFMCNRVITRLSSWFSGISYGWMGDKSMLLTR